MPDNNPIETLEDFKNSFNYGSRSDLNFKFLRKYSNEEAGNFFQELLWKLGDFLDDGDSSRIIDFIFESQQKGYSGAGKYIYENALFTKPDIPLSQMRLALLTSSGHFVEGDDPKPFGVENMTQQEAEARIIDFIKNEPTLSEIPTKTPINKLKVRHGGYDVRGALADPNVNFPITRLNELQAEGRIGEVFPTAYSFVGACSQIRLQKYTAPKWVKMFQEQNINAVLLVPV